jgi:dTDP-4-amino-4,6-dideoxygalactose transaminase
MPDLNAALALSQWERLEEFIDARWRIANRYDEYLGANVEVVRPSLAQSSSWYRYVIRTHSQFSRDHLISTGLNKGIRFGTVDIVDSPETLSRIASYAHSEWCKCTSLPIYPGLTEEDQSKIVEIVIKSIAR